MKKWIIGLFVFLVITIAAIYIFIPSSIIISKTAQVNCSASGANRVLNDEHNWPGWWPEKNALVVDKEVAPSLMFDGFTYNLSQKFYNGFEVIISRSDFAAISRINIIKTSVESTILGWELQVSTSLNPWKRIDAYRRANRMGTNMTAILSSLKSYLENNEKVYGVNLHQIISKDSTLIFTSRIIHSYPNTELIYELIGMLKKHIVAEGGSMNNVPMLHVKTLPDSKYELLVAIPVNGKLRETATIVNKRFVPWKTIVGDVKGGTGSVQNALQQMKYYIEDYQRSAMGIPFELLITDRTVQPDSTKWVTRICQAVS